MFGLVGDQGWFGVMSGGEGCLAWRSDLVSLIAAADAVIAAAYLSIPLVIFQIVRQRGGFGFPRTALLFAAFIGVAALAHFASIFALWSPLCGLVGTLKATSALLALATAALVWKLRPALLAIHGPDDWARQAASLEGEITRRRAAEAEVRHAHSELEGANRALEARVAERTADLTAANEELQRYAYIASHDLRAPLRALMTIPEWLRESMTERLGEIPDEIEEDLFEMERQSRRLDCLLTDLLAYARIGQSGEDWQVLEPEPLIAESIALAGVPDGFRVALRGPFPRIYATPTEFKLAIRNLVSNAVKHHDRADGAITISATAAPGETVIEVADDGPGIEPRYAEKIFEMFSTLRPRDEVEGSGMGLAMVKKSMERCGGRVRLAAAAPGARGARLELHFPELTSQGVTEETRNVQSPARGRQPFLGPRPLAQAGSMG